MLESILNRYIKFEVIPHPINIGIGMTDFGIIRLVKQLPVIPSKERDLAIDNQLLPPVQLLNQHSRHNKNQSDKGGKVYGLLQNKMNKHQ